MPDNRIIPASEVETKIRSGEPEVFDNCTIAGDLNLIGLIIEGPVHFNHTVFQNSVSFKYTVFNGTAYFLDSEFNSTADLSYSKFNSTADFSYSKFNNIADFSYSKFNNIADFSYSKFNNIADFSHSKFDNIACFWYSTFNRKAVFSFSRFNNDGFFTSSKFNNDAIFSSSKFNTTTVFSYSKFNSTTDFSYSKFNSNAYFCGSNFNSKAVFSFSKFNNTTVFSYSKFNSTANFYESKFEKETNFNDVSFNGITSFNNSQFVGNSLFLNATFSGTLYLIRTKYNRLYIKWDNIHSLAYDDTAYQLLIEDFRNLGFNKDADNCYYQFRIDQLLHWGESTNDQERSIINKLWEINENSFIHRFGLGDKLMYTLDLGAWIFYGYGKKPLYPLGWSIGAILFFGVIWGILIQRRQVEFEYSFAQYQKRSMWDKLYSVLDPFIFSITIFLSGTKLFVDSPKVPEIPRVSNSLIKVIFTLERVLGAFFSILFFLAIGTTVIRQ